MNVIHRQYYTPIMVTLLHYAVMEHVSNKRAGLWKPTSMTMPMKTSTEPTRSTDNNLVSTDNNNKGTRKHEHNIQVSKHTTYREPHGLCTAFGVADIGHRTGGIMMINIGQQVCRQQTDRNNNNNRNNTNIAQDNDDKDNDNNIEHANNDNDCHTVWLKLRTYQQ